MGVSVPHILSGLLIASIINGNYCFPDPQVQLPVKSEGLDQVRSKRTVNLHVVDLEHSVTGLLQKEKTKFEWI